jgi:threonine dehydratase
MALKDFPLFRLTEARARIGDHVVRTPLSPSPVLSTALGVDVYLKQEGLQATGSFKARGALNRLRTLSPEARARGVATISAGNHAQAVAWAAGTAGVPSLVVMPEHASPLKVARSRAYGAEVVLHGDAAQAFQRVRELCEERHLTFLHPFDDPEVVAGHASCGLEILEDLPEVAQVVVPVGGGGLSSGIAAALAAQKSSATLWGVEPRGASAMHASFAAGEAVHLPHVDTAADGLAPPMAGSLNYEILKQRAEGIILVDEADLARGVKHLVDAEVPIEPSGAAGVAALLAGHVDGGRGGPVVIVLSGRNATDELNRSLIERYL